MVYFFQICFFFMNAHYCQQVLLIMGRIYGNIEKKKEEVQNEWIGAHQVK